mgnify:CR=1 FL=1
MEKAHINTGFRKVLEIPSFYDLFQTLIGGNLHREEHFKKHIINKKIESILDIGCGTAVLLDHLLDKKIKYIGCDMQQSYITKARNKYKDKGEFYCEKVGEHVREEWIGKFDIINAHGLLHHLSDEESKALLEISSKYLKPEGFLVTVDSLFHDQQSKLSKWLVSKDRGQNIRQPKEYLKLAGNYFRNVESYIDDKSLRIPYSIFTMIMYKS